MSMGAFSASSTRSATSTASCERSTSSTRTANSSPPKRATVSVGRTAPRMRCGDLLQDGVAGGVSEAVVDRLEVVEVDEDHAHRRLLARRPGERVLDAVGEQRPVGEAGDGIVERLVGELVLEELALADVAAVEHDALDVLVVQQVGVPDLELEPLAGAAAQAALDHARAADARRRRPRPPASAGRGRWAAPAGRSGCSSPRRPCSRAPPRSRGSGRRPCRCGRARRSGRSSARRSERKRASLRPPVQVLGQERAVDRERHLGGQRLERAAHLGAVHAGDARRSGTRFPRRGRRARAARRRRRGRARARRPARAGCRPSAPARRSCAARRGQPRAHGGRDAVLGGVLVEAHQARVGVGSPASSRTAAAAAASICVHARGAHERDAGAAQGALARDGPLLLAHEAGHAGQHEQEHDHRGDDHHDHVGVAPLLVEADPRGDQAGHAQERRAAAA